MNPISQTETQLMQLSYHGQTFNYTPTTTRTAPHYKVVTRQLMYRSQVIDAGIATETESRLPAAVNWRFLVH